MIKDDFIIEEGAMPQPAPGKKVRSFSLPVADEKPARKRTTKQLAVPEEPHEEDEQPISAEFLKYNAEDFASLSDKPRRRAREVALLIFCAAVAGSAWKIVPQIADDAGAYEENAQFALHLAHDAYVSMDDTDKLLAKYARDWDVERFPLVDRNILRLAVAELLHNEQMGHNIIINEAVELGKKFGTDESAAFINGMLDNIYLHEVKNNHTDEGQK